MSDGRARQAKEPADAGLQQAHLRVVQPASESPGRRRRRVRLVLVLSSAFVVAVVFGLVWLHVMLAQNQFRLDRLDNQVAADQSHYERSRLQVDQLESPQRIVQQAEGKLGMVVPSTVIYLPPSPAAGSAATAASSPAAGSAATAAPSATLAATSGNRSAPPSSPGGAGRSTTAGTVPPAPVSSNAAPSSGHAPTDWTSVKPLLVPDP